jgi:peptidoglycan biosynthesis protein MviN/MurJ (putative lipid II flippase)
VFAIIALAVTIALDFLLIPRLGIQGAALASTAAYSTNAILILAALKHELRIAWKKLLLPTNEDLAVYKHAWSRLKDWSRQATAMPSGQPE